MQQFTPTPFWDGKRGKWMTQTAAMAAPGLLVAGTIAGAGTVMNARSMKNGSRAQTIEIVNGTTVPQNDTMLKNSTEKVP